MLNIKPDINFLAYVFENDFLIAIPEIFFLLAVSYLLVYGLYFGSNIKPNQHEQGSNLISQKLDLFVALSEQQSSSRSLSTSGIQKSMSPEISKGTSVEQQPEPCSGCFEEATPVGGNLTVPSGAFSDSKESLSLNQSLLSPQSLSLNQKVLLRSSAFFYAQPTLLSQNICWLGLLSLQLTGILFLNSPIFGAIFFFNGLVSDFFTLFLKLFLIFGGSCVLIIGFQDFKKINHFESIILILFSLLGLFTLISSYNFITLYLAIELQSLCFYVLVASRSHSEFATEAGIKYFILGAFSSAMLLYGISLVYGFSGTVQFQELWLIIAQNTLPLGGSLGFIFILLGFLFKITAAPFHTWAPDVYEGAATNITAFLAIVPKIAVFGAFLRLLLETTMLPSSANLLQRTYEGLQSYVGRSWSSFSSSTLVGESNKKSLTGLEGDSFVATSREGGLSMRPEPWADQRCTSFGGAEGVPLDGKSEMEFLLFSGNISDSGLLSLTTGYTDHIGFFLEGVSPTIFYIFMISSGRPRRTRENCSSQTLAC